jgi:hypothetical protein
MAIVSVGIDLAKDVFAVQGVDESGKPALVRPSVPRPQVGGAHSGLPGWMTAVPSIPVVDAVVLLGKPMTASCQAP